MTQEPVQINTNVKNHYQIMRVLRNAGYAIKEHDDFYIVYTRGDCQQITELIVHTLGIQKEDFYVKKR